MLKQEKYICAYKRWKYKGFLPNHNVTIGNSGIEAKHREIKIKINS